MLPTLQCSGAGHGRRHAASHPPRRLHSTEAPTRLRSTMRLGGPKSLASCCACARPALRQLSSTSTSACDAYCADAVSPSSTSLQPASRLLLVSTYEAWSYLSEPSHQSSLGWIQRARSEHAKVRLHPAAHAQQKHDMLLMSLLTCRSLASALVSARFLNCSRSSPMTGVLAKASEVSIPTPG